MSKLIPVVLNTNYEPTEISGSPFVIVEVEDSVDMEAVGDACMEIAKADIYDAEDLTDSDGDYVSYTYGSSTPSRVKAELDKRVAGVIAVHAAGPLAYIE